MRNMRSKLLFSPRALGLAAVILGLCVLFSAGAWAKPNVANSSYAKLRVGDKVKFGTCIQGAMGQEAPIEWQVLERDESGLLLIATKGLAAHLYHDYLVPSNWSECTLRRWLNGHFLDNSFNDAEKKRLVTVHLSNPVSKFESQLHNGPATDDKFFVLSHEEVEKYLPTPESRRCQLTAYAIRCGAEIDNESRFGHWWLRSLGDFMDTAAYVDNHGAVKSTAFTRVFVAVRPVIKIAY